MIQPTNMQQPYPAQGGANAVSINIFNPQAYGAAQNQQQAAAVQTPNYTNSLYNMPQASLYQPQQPQFPMGAPQMLPAYQPVTPQYNPEMFNQYAIIPPQGMTMQTAQPIAQIMPQEPVAQAAPAPQMMPASVLQPQGYNGPQLVQTSPQEVLEQELTPAQKEEYKGPQLVETQPQV
ncbi:hypothetical protein IJ670_05535, partial [bacterium]|nr:hypothetical protein [bacterium]